MRPLGSKRRNQSFFCSLVMMLLKVGIVSHGHCQTNAREVMNFRTGGLVLT